MVPEQGGLAERCLVVMVAETVERQPAADLLAVGVGELVAILATVVMAAAIVGARMGMVAVAAAAGQHVVVSMLAVGAALASMVRVPAVLEVPLAVMVGVELAAVVARGVLKGANMGMAAMAAMEAAAAATFLPATVLFGSFGGMVGLSRPMLEMCNTRITKYRHCHKYCWATLFWMNVVTLQVSYAVTIKPYDIYI